MIWTVTDPRWSFLNLYLNLYHFQSFICKGNIWKFQRTSLLWAIAYVPSSINALKFVVYIFSTQGQGKCIVTEDAVFPRGQCFCAPGWQVSQKYSWNAFLHLGHNGSLDRQSSSRQCSEVLQNLFGISGSLDVEIMLNYRGSNAKPKVSGVETLQKNTTRLILRWKTFDDQLLIWQLSTKNQIASWY